MAYYQKYLDYFLKKTFGKIRWGYFVFFVTNRCNSKCKHCFYWKNLNSGLNELNLDEISNISKKTGAIEVLLLSGGEPFLREDLFDVISIFIKNNKVKVISIPTNCLLTNKITETADKLTKHFPNVLFSINPSIDQLYEKNDEIRGVPGSFDKAINTLKSLEKLKKSRKNLELVINTTVSMMNYKDVDKMIEFFKQFDITYHNFELLRGSPKKNSLNLPSVQEIKKIHLSAIRARNYYIIKNAKKQGFLSRFLERMSVLGILKYTQKIKEDVLKNKKLPFICSAGKNIVVVEPTGDVKLCELLPSVGNLRKYDYDLEKLLKDKQAKTQFEFIKTCKCTHVCFLNMSIANDNKSLFKIPSYFLRWKK